MPYYGPFQKNLNEALLLVCNAYCNLFSNFLFVLSSKWLLNISYLQYNPFWYSIKHSSPQSLSHFLYLESQRKSEIHAVYWYLSSRSEIPVDLLYSVYAISTQALENYPLLQWLFFYYSRNHNFCTVHVLFSLRKMTCFPFGRIL